MYCLQLREHAAFDIMVTSPLIFSILTAAKLSEGAAAEEAETRKHKINDPISVWSWAGCTVNGFARILHQAVCGYNKEN